MKRSRRFTFVLGSCLALALLAARPRATGDDDRKDDFGLFIADQLREHSQQLFGISRPLAESVLGPYDGADNTAAIKVARGLSVSLVSSSVASAADQIALWPDDDHPTHLFVCDEETSNSGRAARRPVVAAEHRMPRRSSPVSSSCDPVRRTPWGTIIVAEEAGATGGLYEILDPAQYQDSDQRQRSWRWARRAIRATSSSGRRSGAWRSRASRSGTTER